MKKISLFFSFVCLFAISQNAEAATYTYTATNFQTISCPYGASVTAGTVTSGDTVKIIGTGFENRDISDGIPESIYLPGTTPGKVYSIQRELRDEGGPVYYGLMSWNDSEINTQVMSGTANSLGSYMILRRYSSVDGNSGSCVRATLTAGYICSSFTYSDWGVCTNRQQTRTVITSSPDTCTGGNPILTQQCTPACTANDYSCGDWGVCSVNSEQTRTCSKLSSSICDGGISMPATSQSCIYTPPVCTSWTYSNWSSCTNNQQTRTIASSSPDNCTGGNPVLTQSCQQLPKITSATPQTIHSIDEVITIQGVNFASGNNRHLDCDDLRNGLGLNVTNWTDTSVQFKFDKNDWHYSIYAKNKYKCEIQVAIEGAQDFFSNEIDINIDLSQTCTSWTYSDWGTCSVDGKQTRTISNSLPQGCAGGRPVLTQSCVYTPPQPACTDDTWSCNDWNSCSANGIQTRSCRRTFDCPGVETAPPQTSQLCQSQYQPQQSIPESSQNVSTTLIKATVKLLCPLNKTSYSQGSGTVIDSTGTILTNRHVVQGTIGCVVGFINDPSDEPNFSEIAFVTKISSAEDVALLKIDNKSNKSFSSVNVYNGNSQNLRLGDRIKVLGYPDYAQSGGSNLTYTSGDFSGFGSRADGLGNYLKTNAILEHGNSGGGAYTSNDTFIGIPTLVLSGELNAQSYLLSINTIKTWLNSTSSGVSSAQQRTGLTVSSLIGMINDESEDLNAPDLSNTRVIIYGNKSKQQTLPNSPGKKQTKKQPIFQITGVDDESGVAGYYIYFGSKINANPVTAGRFKTKPDYTPPAIKKQGVYYFIFKAKDENGNISDSYITEYRYKK